MVTAQEIFDAYFNALIAGGAETCKDYRSDSAWTPRASLALVKAGQVAFPSFEAASRPHKDHAGRSEYMAIDVTLYDRNTWKAPIFIAEHENRIYENLVQYSTWKLLAVEAQRRMLVAYFGEGTEIPSFDRLKELVQEVCDDNPGKDILLVGGPCDVETEDANKLVSLQETAIVGKHE